MVALVFAPRTFALNVCEGSGYDAVSFPIAALAAAPRTIVLKVRESFRDGGRLLLNAAISPQIF